MPDPMPDPITDPATGRRSPVWMRVLLVVSLALNLAVAGVVLGAVGSGKSGGPRTGDVSFGPYTAALSDEDRRALRRAVRQQSSGEGRVAARANFQSFLAVLRTDPLDVAEMTRLFEAQGDLARARQEAGKTALLGRITEMSTAERQAFADRLESALKRGPRPRDRALPD